MRISRADRYQSDTWMWRIGSLLVRRNTKWKVRERSGLAECFSVSNDFFNSFLRPSSLAAAQVFPYIFEEPLGTFHDLEAGETYYVTGSSKGWCFGQFVCGNALINRYCTLSCRSFQRQQLCYVGGFWSSVW